MHLRRIRIYGFKSFGQDVAIELSPGITALVGPNGGGKSNVVDAVRWALGEQRLRDLRAERWDDLLFQGGAGRPPARLAEVSMEFDNRDGEMPYWPESLTVARRYYRSGDSEYLVNGQPVRLKDVTDLFLDSGLGRFSYAIVGQGRVEGALLLKAADRLELLEEAAGVSRYKVRKRETLGHLQETEDKLVRLGDLLADTARQMEAVRTRAETESRYRTWEAERSAWQRQLDHAAYRRAMAKQAELAQQLEAIGDDRRSLAETLVQVTNEIGQVRAEMERLSSASDKEAADVGALEERERALGAEYTEWEATARELAREAALVADQIQAARRRRGELSEELRRVEPAATAEGPDEADAEAAREFAEAVRAAERLRDEVAAVAAALEPLRRDRAQVQEQLARLQGLLQLSGEGASFSDALSRRKAEAQRLDEELRKLDGELAMATAERQRLGASHRRLDEELAALERRIAGAEARLRVLQQLDADGEGVPAGVRAVLQASRAGRLAGVVGTLGRLIRVPDLLSVAIATALGAARTDVVAETEQAARDAVRYLKDGSLGRATFLPLDTVRGAAVASEDRRRIARTDGIVGWAAELVECADAVRPAVDHVLGRVLVAETLDDAVRLGRAVRYRYKTVTLDGQVLHAGGAITGGSRAAGAEHGPNRQAEVAEMTRRLSADREQMAAKDALRRTLRTDWEQAEQRVERLHEQVSERRREWRQVHEWLALERTMDDPGVLLNQLDELNRQIALYEDRWSVLSHSRDESAARAQALRERGEAYERRLRAYEQAERERRLIEHRIRAELERVAGQDAELRDREAALNAERIRAEERLARTRALKEEAADAIRRTRDAARQRQQSLARAQERLAKLEDRRRALELEDRKLEQRVHHHRQALLELHVRYEHYAPPGDARPLTREEEEAGRREVRRLTELLASLDPVVPGSLALFESLAERHAFLERERRDVQEAREELEATLRDIDAEMQRRVKETAGRVEDAFREACRHLYGGGEAGFSWVGGEDGGVDLWVRPPGKRPSRLSLLSGGEKALGGIAWLFGLLSVRSAPFVLLDEVEASLDEASAARFAQYLQTRRPGTQYVVVTHHRQTMEVADVLWGVAADSTGHSRLVSVKLSDAQPAAT